MDARFTYAGRLKQIVRYRIRRGISIIWLLEFLLEVLMEKWQCTVCGYIYDPEEGDPDNGVDPGTKFEDIPKDWVCPVCGAEKDLFEKL